MGMKMSDEKIDKLFEGMSREAAREVANQGSPTKRATAKKTTAKKDVKKKSK